MLMKKVDTSADLEVVNSVCQQNWHGPEKQKCGFVRVSVSLRKRASEIGEYICCGQIFWLRSKRKLTNRPES